MCYEIGDGWVVICDEAKGIEKIELKLIVKFVLGRN